MKSNKLSFILSLASCIFLLASIFTNPVFSQENQVSMSIFTEIQLKPGMEDEFEKFMKDEVIPAMKQGGQQEMSVWKTAVFGGGATYVLTSPVTALKQFDSPHPVVNAVGPYGARAMWAKMVNYSESVKSFMMWGVPDLEIAPPEGYSQKLGFQVKVTVAPGQDKKYEKDSKIIKAVLQKTKVKGFYTGRVGLGGNPNQYYFLVLVDSFADMQAWGMAWEKAASETKMPEMTGVVNNIEYSMYAYDPGLSIQPQAQ